MYKMLRGFLFLFDPEAVHYFSMNCVQALRSIGFIRSIIRRSFVPLPQPRTVLGLNFQNPVGLGAGFDKNAKYLDVLSDLGFGFIEIGTVTPQPQAGNEKPRLFRLPKDLALINRMGFNNDGVEVIAERMKAWRANNGDTKLIVGGNIGKNKTTSNEHAWQDYLACFERLHEVVDYFVVNVSSPNTPALRELQSKPALTKIFTELQAANGRGRVPKPLLLKIAPDLDYSQLDDIIDLAVLMKLSGLIIANTTISRDNLHTTQSELISIGDGGLSGAPLKQKSTELINYIHNKTGDSLVIIGSGGIFTGVDAEDKITAGATLVQVWTGFIYVGPSIVQKICNYLQSR